MNTSDRYTAKFRSEIETFSSVTNVHDLPAIFHVWSQKFVRPKIEKAFGITVEGMESVYAHCIEQYAVENPEKEILITSIGAGNGDLETRIAKLLLKRNVRRFRFSCMDINPTMLNRGREAALEEGLAEYFEFCESDVSDWRPSGPPGVVMASHSLHHIEALEDTFAKVADAIGENGYFVTADMIGRNGHMRWPEALELVQRIWDVMPDHYKRNQQTGRFEETFENVDYSTEGFEGIRAQDILPLLTGRFAFEAFAAFGNLPDVFVDRGFGHNLHPENPEDVAFINWVGELNDRLISEGKIKPTQMVAIMRTTPRSPCRHYLHWTPEYCVRPPQAIYAPAVASHEIKEEVQMGGPPEEVAPLPNYGPTLTGLGHQEGIAAGYCPDCWLVNPFSVNIRLEGKLESIVIGFYFPETVQQLPNLQIAINGAAALLAPVRPGEFSFRISTEILAGELLNIRISSENPYSPQRAGIGSDDRELLAVLRQIQLVSPGSSTGAMPSESDDLSGGIARIPTRILSFVLGKRGIEVVRRK